MQGRNYRRIALVAGLCLGAALLLPASADAAVSRIRYVKRATTLKANNRTTLRVPCPAGFRVSGGGVTVEHTSTQFTVGQSGPYDNADRGKVPDDGWVGTMNNPTTVRPRMTVQAICVRGEALTYAAVTTGVDPNTSASVPTDCPASTVTVGGGATVTGTTSNFVELVWSAPRAADLDNIPDDGWIANLSNHTDGGPTLVTHAICAPAGSYAYFASTATVPAMSGKVTLIGLCPNNDFRVTAVGTTFVSPGIRLHGLAPADYSGNGVPDNGTIVHLSNGGPSPESSTAWTVCTQLGT